MLLPVILLIPNCSKSVTICCHGFSSLKACVKYEKHINSSEVKQTWAWECCNSLQGYGWRLRVLLLECVRPSTGNVEPYTILSFQKFIFWCVCAMYMGCVCVHTWVSCWRSEFNFMELVLYFHLYMDPGESNGGHQVSMTSTWLDEPPIVPTQQGPDFFVCLFWDGFYELRLASNSLRSQGCLWMPPFSSCVYLLNAGLAVIQYHTWQKMFLFMCPLFGCVFVHMRVVPVKSKREHWIP